MAIRLLCTWPGGCDRSARDQAQGKYCYLEGHTPLKARRYKDDLENPRPPVSERPKRTPSTNGVRVHASGGASFSTDSDRLAKLLTGEMSVEDLDDDELARGYPKDRNGGFAGRPPKVIPLVVHQRIQREFYKRMEDKMKTALPDALQMLSDIATAPHREDRDRLKAIDMILNRIMGKPLEKLEISTGEKPFEMTMGKMRRSAPKPEPEEAESAEA